MRRLWQFLRTPSATYSLGFLIFLGGIGGIVFWGGFHTVLHATNSLEFCIGCHEMRENAYEEYSQSAHFQNASGVRAVCSDCHVPHSWGPMLVRKIYASREIYHWLAGTISTPERYDAHRLEMAQRVWASMEATDSRECRNCHSYEAMDFAAQSREASTAMQEAHASGETCISCHRGIAHELPDMTAGYRAAFRNLQQLASVQSPDADVLYTIETTSAYLNPDDVEAGGRGDGSVLPATGLQVLEHQDNALRVRLEGWQQDGADRVIYAHMGQRIIEAALAPSAIERIERHETLVDDATDLTWHDVSIEFWVPLGGLVDDVEELWSYGEEMHIASCSTCHSLHEAEEYLANQWIGVMNSMERFITLDNEETRLLQRYLQLHASDIETAEEGSS